jgi:hypothetical protein
VASTPYGSQLRRLSIAEKRIANNPPPTVAPEISAAIWTKDPSSLDADKKASGTLYVPPMMKPPKAPTIAEASASHACSGDFSLMQLRRSACSGRWVIFIGTAPHLVVFLEASSGFSRILPVSPRLCCLSAGFQPFKQGVALNDRAQPETREGWAFAGSDQIVQVLPRHPEAVSGFVNRQSTARGVLVIHLICPGFLAPLIQRGR